jgi:GntR family transcriptional regulator
MHLRLTPASAVPIYRQLIDQVRERIAVGQLKVGDRLPSVRELAQALPANQNTVLKAYDLLEREGLIERRHGNGTFVSASGIQLSSQQRRKQLSAALRDIATKATLFNIAADEVHTLLDKELKRVQAEAEDSE